MKILRDLFARQRQETGDSDALKIYWNKIDSPLNMMGSN